MADEETHSVESCPRCYKRHESLIFVPLAGREIYCGPFEVLTHWARCPNTDDPVLMGNQILPECATMTTR